MKKYNYLLLLSAVTATAAFTSCDEDKLEIPQKGVTPMEEFYLTDEDAESALVTVYADTYDNLAFMGDVTGWNYSPYLALTTFLGDDIFLAGSGTGDCGPEREYHDFRYNTSNNVVLGGYTGFYRSIHKCNLLLNHFEEVANPTQTMKRCIAEARVMRAWDHLMLGIYWGRPPIVTTVLTKEDAPANSGSQEEVMQWVVDEINAALPDLDERQSPDDFGGAVKITKGFANAVKGKALLWKKDYAGAKAALQEVIKSGKYALVPSEDMQKIGHSNGKGSSEIVFEFNVQPSSNVNISGSNRQIGNFPYTFNWRYEFFNGTPTDGRLLKDGWGWVNPSKAFCEALIANDGMDSYRRKAWIISYEELLYNLQWPGDKVENGGLEMKIDGKDTTYTLIPGKTDAKVNDPGRGLGKEYYGNCGYFCWKTVMHEPNDNAAQNWCGTWNKNFTIMRYAEVLLMYAEACAQLGETSGEGLKVLNDIQYRAGSAHVSAALSLEEVQNEKWFEMFQDGCRGVDLIRWGKTETLKTQDHEVWNLVDESSKSKKDKDGNWVVIIPHKWSVVKDAQSDIFKNAGAGFKPGKSELLPFPETVINLNSNLEQNPGW